jgi:HK97 family phage major capsid protein
MDGTRFKEHTMKNGENDIRVLRQKRADLKAEALGILNRADAAKRVPTPGESARLDQIAAETALNDRAIQAEEHRMDIRRQSMPTSSDQQNFFSESEGKPLFNLGETLQQAVLASRPGSLPDPRFMGTQAALQGANETIGSEGGFLVDAAVGGDVFARTYSTSAVASRCRRITISTNANGLKIPACDETSRANGSRWGGVQAYWAAEGNAVTKSAPKFRLMELSLKKLMALGYCTSELLQDAAALNNFMSTAFSEELAFRLDDSIINGTGAGQCLGLLNSNAVVSVPIETGQVSKTVLAQNIIKMHARMWPPSRANAVWFINQDVEPQLNMMSLPVGTGGIPVYLPPGGLSQSPYATLYGKPVVPIERCPTLGSVGDVIFADMSQYVLIDKGGMRADSSIHVEFLSDQVVFRYVLRVDGQPLWNNVLTPYKGSATVSPFVVLAAR